MKPILNYSITVMAAALLVCSCDSSSCYRRHHDGESLYAVLHEQVRPGDSIEEVQELLGKGQAPDQRDKMIEVTKKVAETYPMSYPDGVQEDDVFLGYPIGKGATLYLQFRNSKLVNHIPEHFAEYEPFTAIMPFK